MKFGVCTIIKNENLYLREWVEYYINLGFEKIILYNNNDENGEIPDVVIHDYIDEGIVDIISCQTQSLNVDLYFGNQTNSYNDCLSRYKNELDWIAFCDIDEFIYIEKYKKIQYLFENTPQYNNFDSILMSWRIYGNPDELYYRNESVQKRFNKELQKVNIGTDLNLYTKPIVKTSSTVLFSHGNPHIPIAEKTCNAFCIECYIPNRNCNTLNGYIHEILYVKHYYTKSLSEYLYRYKMFAHKRFYGIKRYIDVYKHLHGWTEKHEKIYKNFIKQLN